MDRLKIRRVKAAQTVSYQVGRYEMRGVPGYRRSVFKVEVHLGEYASAQEALSEWPKQIARLRDSGRESKADSLEEKLSKLKRLTKGAR